jgi:hypothetical protein
VQVALRFDPQKPQAEPQCVHLTLGGHPQAVQGVRCYKKQTVALDKNEAA